MFVYFDNFLFFIFDIKYGLITTIENELDWIIFNEKNYFENIQKKETEYKPMISENDPPATYLNVDIMERYKNKLKEFYFDETKYDTYLDQLGVKYPVIKDD